MRPLYRSEHRDAPRATDVEPPPPTRSGVGTLLCYVDAWICAGRALLLEADYTNLYGQPRLWHDPLSGCAEPFERAVARARKDARGGRLEPFARLVAQVEETLVRADGWTPTPTEHGVLWREPDADGTPRSLTESAAVVMVRVVRQSEGAPPTVAVGRSVVREGYDQRSEVEGDEVAQAPAPEDEALPPWIGDPAGYVAVEGAWPEREPLGESVHGGDVAPTAGRGECT